MKRSVWVLIHRWAGHGGFLIVVGLTGSLLAFLPELNRALTPHLFPATRPAKTMGLGELALAAQAVLPEAEVTQVYVDSSGAAIIGFEPRFDPATGKPYELDFNQLFLDARTGRELGRRTVEGLPTGLDNLMPFIYRLHYNLSLGAVGGWILGITALVWTIDCFVAFYLTLPARRSGSLSLRERVRVKTRAVKGIFHSLTPALSQREKGNRTSADRSFWQRWKPAWKVKWTASGYRINFDLHRAGGLWLWIMLLVFAWSSVGFNLHQEVYQPVMELFFDFPTENEPAEREPLPNAVPLGWIEAQATAERLMREQAERYGFTIEEPVALYRQPERARYHYRVKSSLDVGYAATAVHFDLYSGRLLDVYLPTGHHSGHTATTWLSALHEAKVFGLPYRIFVCLLGLAIVMLSVTGIVIWLRKRRARAFRRVAGESAGLRGSG
jgi:uncharacterized iron-regulated membrane protein